MTFDRADFSRIQVSLLAAILMVAAGAAPGAGYRYIL